MRSVSPADDVAGPTGNHPEVRRQLIALIRKRRRTTQSTPDRPARLRFREIHHPESDFSPDRSTVWDVIVGVLDSSVPLEQVSLLKPPGKTAWVLKARLATDGPLIYIKLQIINGARVALRSFHPSRYDHD